MALGPRFHGCRSQETGVSQWEKPDTLMSESERIVNSGEWKQYRIWDGRIFYYNKETKVSCWSMPPELRKLRGESTGLDDRPLAETSAERRMAFQDFLKQQGIDVTWDWRRVQSLAREAPPSAQGLSCLADTGGEVMERLEEKHQKARAEKRTAREPRTADAAAVLARRDELQEEDPPIEALRVWVSMRELRHRRGVLASTKELDLKNKVQSQFYRDERKRNWDRTDGCPIVVVLETDC
eukprot:Skav224145  [mRNA]  locus=scaffold462:305431:314813:- [translate_table: standard]